MSTTETPGALAPPVLTDQQKQLSDAILGNPLEYPDGFNAYLEQFILLRIPTNPAFQILAQKMAYPVGFPRLVMEDLTANTSEYVWTDPVTGLGYLYCNGAAVSQTTYADLYAQWGASKWAADSGGNFYLPDTRGRSLFLCGTNSATDLGDNDGVTESSRQPKHTHTDSLTLPNHIHGPSGIVQTGGGGGDIPAGSGYGQGNTGNPTTNPSIDGSVGSGMSGSDAIAHIVIGSLVVRF